MSDYKLDTHYDLSHLTLEEKIECMKYCKSISNCWWIDELDCSKSWRRKKIDMKFSEVLKKVDKTTIFNIIHRRGYEHQKKDLNKQPFNHKRWAIEVGFTTFSAVSYYLWIYIPEDRLEEIKDKFKLKPVNYDISSS